MDAQQQTVPHIAVAVSGGADSLYSLIRLREKYPSVMALHGLFFLPRNERETEEKDAAQSGLTENCRKLGIPLHIVDLSREFLQLVILPFVQSYADGLTPNPCALCNARIKFGLLQDAAATLGAEMLATGHYARLVYPHDGGMPALFQGRDHLKDQSYFLALTPPERLAKALFPLGHTSKKDVLASLAAENVTIPLPGESQEVCFVQDDAYREFLPRTAAQLGISLPGPGPMLLRNGQRLGTHKGLWNYTEGQRKGLGIGWKEPLHVLGKEVEGNALRLGPRREMQTAGCRCDDANLLLPPEQWPEQVLVKTRYREQPKPARVTLDIREGGKPPGMSIHFLQGETSVAAGQVAAVYVPGEGEEGLRLVAGGVIKKALITSA